MRKATPTMPVTKRREHAFMEAPFRGLRVSVKGAAKAPLDRLAKRWPGSRLVEIWNALPGQKPVKKFTNRKVAISRIWAAAQSLAPDQSPRGIRLVPGKATVGKRPRKTQKPVTAGRRGKTGRVLELL